MQLTQKMNRRFFRTSTVFFGLIAACCLNQTAIAQPPSFQSAFGSNMVLPHSKPVTLSGHAAPNTKLTLAINNKNYEIKSNSNGAWQTKVAALTAGETYNITLKNSDGESTTLNNVLAGELWLCSGQSNMAYNVNASIDQPEQYNQGHPSIRLLTIPQIADVTAHQELPDNVKWQLATDESAPYFSAVCYFFARKRFEETGVPLGLINSSWGGSILEAWMSESTLGTIDGYARKVKQLQQLQTNRRAAELSFAEDWVNWWQSISDQGPVWEQGVLDSTREWIHAPLKDWKTYDDVRMQSHHGNIWFSVSFELTEAQQAKGATFVLGAIDEVDTTWINGKFINNTFGYGTRREYKLEPGVLKTGTNQITTFVTNTWGAGGMTGPAEDVGIAFDDGEFIPLGNSWKYQFIPTSVGYPPRTPWESVAGISGMYNAMIAPLLPLQPTGAIWYQGESNAESADNYQDLLTGLIKDWRKHFRNKKMPFVIVQLPNYGTNQLTEDSGPAKSGWATLRNAQQQVALADKQVGIVVTHDLGDDIDIHPKQKFAVGVRTAEVVNALQNGGMSNGVVAQIVSKSNNSIDLEFSPPLVANETTAVTGFALCKKAGDCVFVEAKQNGNTISVSRTALPDAKILRYCWSDGGQCNLKATNGIPASSFELKL